MKLLVRLKDIYCTFLTKHVYTCVYACVSDFACVCVCVYAFVCVFVFARVHTLSVRETGCKIGNGLKNTNGRVDIFD